MDSEITLKIVFLFILLLFSGFFSGSEASLFSLTPLHLHKMKEGGNPFLVYVQRLLNFPRRLLITILVGNETVNITISVLATSIFLSLLGVEGKWVAIAVTTIVLLIVGEAIPKTLAVTYPIRFSTFVSLPLSMLARFGRPAVWFLEKISDFFVHLFGKRVTAVGMELTEDEFKNLVDAGHQEGALDESEKGLIHKVFELADTTVAKVMTSRDAMFTLPLAMDSRTMKQAIIEGRYSRIPIYQGDKDNIIGILHVKHLLAEITSGKKDVRVDRLLTKPCFVPMEKGTDAMLRDFQRKKMQMAIVVDEYGKIAGLVTLDDIIDNIFGRVHEDVGDGAQQHGG